MAHLQGIVRSASVVSPALLATWLCCSITPVTADAPASQHSARTIQIEGSTDIVRTWREDDGTDWYAISTDGDLEWERVTPANYTLDMRIGQFDPLFATPGTPTSLQAINHEGDDLYVVQFITQPLQSYRDAIAVLGGKVHKYLPNHAYLTTVDAAGAAQLRKHNFVRWVGRYAPSWKLDPALVDAIGMEEQTLPVQSYNIMMVSDDNVQKHELSDELEARGAVVTNRRAGKRMIKATMNQQQLIDLAASPKVYWIDLDTEVSADMVIARQIGGADFLEGLDGYTGEGVRGEVLDIGFNVGHVDFASRPLLLHTSVATDSHGASTSGINFGDGTGSADARGLLPDGQGIVAGTGAAFEFPGRYTLTAELLESPYYAVFHSSSVGHAQTSAYTSISASMDEMLFDLDILHCQSQSNLGSTASRPESWAKNIVSVGGVFHQNTLTKNDDCWCNGGSIGPAADGRIKPDLCHFYDSIRTVSCCSLTSYTNGFGGTSGATPITAGHFGLLMEMWHRGVFGNIVDPGGTVFENRPHMTTAKALMINAADQYDFTGTSHDHARVHQGWGMADLEELHGRSDEMLVVNETDLIQNLQTNFYGVIVNPGAPDARFTLTWADPAGSPGAGSHRINDLTLRVTSPDGTIYYGNNGLMNGTTSTPGGSANTIDTVENVFIENPDPGTWTVEVIASEINEDGHVETGQMDADYALVVTGIVPIIPPLLVVPQSLPSLVPAGESFEVLVDVIDGLESIELGSSIVQYRYLDTDPYASAALEHVSGDTYRAVLPGAPCDSEVSFYFDVSGDEGSQVLNPPDAPTTTYSTNVGTFVFTFDDDFETDTGWTAENLGATAGDWERGVPINDAGWPYDPESDSDGSGSCWLTSNAIGNSDVDGGAVRLNSPLFDSSGDGVVISYDYFLNMSDVTGVNMLLVEIAADTGGFTVWKTIATHDTSGDLAWRTNVITADDLAAAGVPQSAATRIRFTANDDAGAVVEAGIDAFNVGHVECTEETCPTDVAGDDGVINVGDLLAVLAAWGSCDGCPEDIDGNGAVDTQDLLAVLATWGPCF